MFIWLLVGLGIVCMIFTLIWGIVIQGRSETPKTAVIVGDILMILMCFALLTASFLYQKKYLNLEDTQKTSEDVSDEIIDRFGEPISIEIINESNTTAEDQSSETSNPFAGKISSEESSSNDFSMEDSLSGEASAEDTSTHEASMTEASTPEISTDESSANHSSPEESLNNSQNPFAGKFSD